MSKPSMKPPMRGPGGRGPMGPRPQVKKGTLPRVIKLLYQFYPKLIPVVIFCIIFAAIVNAIPALFTKDILDIIAESIENGVKMAIEKAGNDGVVLCFGSLYTIGDIKNALN